MKTRKLRNQVISNILAGLFLILALFACNNNENPTVSVVKNYVKQNPEYGNLNGTSDMPNWANGKRLEVRTDNGRYLFYISGNEVVGIDKYLENGSREKVFKKESSLTETKSESSLDENLPQYQILFQVELMSGAGTFGEILVLSYSKEIPKKERESTLRKIIKKEGFVSAMLYSTEEAYKANSSESFSKAHPNALKKGYLGQITEQGLFIE
ncbi:MAG: hypothetical protein HOO91_10865 [Bacteroidales bacterium]|nr:hypothetical protein [Bacteroidales bacterium]